MAMVMEVEFLAYVTAHIINIVSMLGVQFTVPVIVPYGRLLGADLSTIALFTTVRGLGGIVSVFWMPRLSDLRGRKLVIMISLFGCAMGYLVQGSASSYPDYSILLFMIGRGMGGFFSGTQPVLRAYIAELCSGNQRVLKQRLMGLQVASQIAGIALMPIAGAVATIGLELPFFVCGVTFAAGALWTLIAFREASEIRALTGSDPCSESIGRSRILSDGRAQEPEEEDERNPLFDKVILLCFTGFFAISIVVSSMALLIPVMLSDPSFGLSRETDEATQGEIATAYGLVSVPFSIGSMVASLCLYLPLTARFGEVPVLLVSGLGATLSMSSYGFWVGQLWQLLIIHGFTGFCFGLLTPSVSPLIARYASVHYRKKMAVCQAVPMFGMMVSSTIGQNMMAFVADQSGLRLCWIICGACNLVFTITLAIAFRMAERRAPPETSLTSEQQKMLLTAGSNGALHAPLDTDKYIESMCGIVRQALEARRGELWNGTAQFLYQDALEKSLQRKLRDWDETTKGREYLDDMHAQLLDHPLELMEFRQMFPHVGNYAHEDDDAFGAAFAGTFTSSSMSFALSRQASSLSQRQVSSPASGLQIPVRQRRSLIQPLASDMQRVVETSL